MTISAKTSVTIEDVAQHAGVSRAAVSKVIRDAYGVSDAMRSRVTASIAELGYRPRAAARAMRGSSYTLGVEIPSIHNHFFPKIINGAAIALTDSQYQLIVAPSAPEDDGYRAINALADRQVDGVISITNVPTRWLEELGKRLPLVTIGRHYDSMHFDTIVSDDVAGAALAVGHLHDLGHRRIVHLTLNESKDPANAGAPHSTRADGYIKAMNALELRPETIWVQPTQDEAARAARRLLDEVDEPVGIFVAHDELALGVLEAVAALRLTPGQASVVGYDDIDLAAHPLISLTSINQSGTHMGGLAVQLLLERIAGRTSPTHEVLAPKVMRRGSTAAPEPRDPRITATGR